MGGVPELREETAVAVLAEVRRLKEEAVSRAEQVGSLQARLSGGGGCIRSLAPFTSSGQLCRTTIRRSALQEITRLRERVQELEEAVREGERQAELSRKVWGGGRAQGRLQGGGCAQGSGRAQGGGHLQGRPPSRAPRAHAAQVGWACQGALAPK